VRLEPDSAISFESGHLHAIFMGVLDPEFISTGRFCLLMRIVGSGSSQRLRESTRFLFSKLF